MAKDDDRFPLFTGNRDRSIERDAAHFFFLLKLDFCFEAELSTDLSRCSENKVSKRGVVESNARFAYFGGFV